MLKSLSDEGTQMDVWKLLHTLLLSSVCLPADMTHVRVRGSTAKIDLPMPPSCKYKFIKLQAAGIVNLSYVSLFFSVSHPPATTVDTVELLFMRNTCRFSSALRIWAVQGLVYKWSHARSSLGGYGFLLVVVWNSDSWLGRVNEDCWCKIKQINHLQAKLFSSCCRKVTMHLPRFAFVDSPAWGHLCRPLFLDEMAEPFHPRGLWERCAESAMSRLCDWYFLSHIMTWLFKGGCREIRVRDICLRRHGL